MTLLTDQPIERRDRPDRGRHVERFLIALVAVALVGIGIQRFRGADDRTATARPAGPAAATSPAGTAAELEVRAAQDPDNPVVWQRLAQVYVQRAAQTLDPAFYGRASAAVDQATALAPDSPGTLTAAAAVSASLHRFADAAAAAERAVELDPYDPAALAVLVDAQIELGRYDDAERSLQTFANRKPGAPVLSRVSYLRELHGDVPGALAAMREARQAVAGAGAFQRATLAAYDGDLLWAVGRIDDAGDAYRDALDADPQHPVATVGWARILASTGRTDDAISTLSRFVDRTPVPAAATLLGDLQTSVGDTTGAEQSYDLVRALSRLQADAGVDVDLDLALFEADHSSPSPELVERARRTATARPTVYALDALAWTLHRSGDAAGARDALDGALRLGTVDPLLHFHAAAILDAAGDDTAAADHLRRAVDRNPWFSVGLRTEARDLASRLGVPWPEGVDR